MAAPAKQALVGLQRRLDLGVTGQQRAVGNAETLGGLALGHAEVADAVLGHEPRGFLRDGGAQVIPARRRLLAHVSGL